MLFILLFKLIEFKSNEVRNAQISENPINLQQAQITGSIKNEQNKDPMMYSFGKKSVTSAGQNIMNAENSDFLVSSLRNQNNMGINVNQVVNGRVVNNSNVIIRTSGSSGGKVGQIQMSGSQSSPGQELRGKREPADTDSRKKKTEENDIKKEINEFPIEPRDSKK